MSGSSAATPATTASGGLIELAEDTSLVEALQITDDEFRTLASVDRDGYVQLTVWDITKD